MPRFLLAQVDPFNKDSCHARVPDDSTAPSSSFFTYDEFSLGPNNTITNGAIAAWFMPNPQQFVAAGTSVDQVSWSWVAAYGGTTATSKQSVLNSQFRLSRPVAHGIRITCGLAPTSVTGYCHVALYSLSLYNQSTWNLPTTLSGMTELPFYRRVTLASLTQNPMIVSNKFLDQTAFRYSDINSNEAASAAKGTFQVANSWMGIMVVVEGTGLIGGATTSITPAITIENICHFEAQSQFGGITQDMQAECPDADMLAGVAEAVSSIDASRPDTPESTNMITRKAVAAFRASAGGRLSDLVSHGAAAAGSYIVDQAMSAAYSPFAAGISGVNSAPSRNQIVGYNR